MTECIVKSVKAENDSIFQPSIANFQNGRLKSDQANKLQCIILKNNENGKVRVVVASEKMAYEGSESPNHLSHTLVTVRSKKKNEIRFVPVATMSFSPLVSQHNAILEKSLNSTDNNLLRLYKEFGSKKNVRRMEQKEKLTMNISNIENKLTNTVSNIEINEEELERPGDTDNKMYLPYINRQAENIHEVFRLDTIITDDELSSLNQLAMKATTDDEEFKKSLEPYVMEHIHKMSKAGEDKLKKVEILLYIDALIKFFKVPAKSITKRNFKIDGYPDSITKKILNEFTVQAEHNSRTRPISMRDKLTSYLTVLSLFALDYEVHLELLTTSSGIRTNKLLEMSKHLGLTVNSDKSKVYLKLPLCKPPKAFGGRLNKRSK